MKIHRLLLFLCHEYFTKRVDSFYMYIEHDLYFLTNILQVMDFITLNFME